MIYIRRHGMFTPCTFFPQLTFLTSAFPNRVRTTTSCSGSVAKACLRQPDSIHGAAVLTLHSVRRHCPCPIQSPRSTTQCVREDIATGVGGNRLMGCGPSSGVGCAPLAIVYARRSVSFEYLPSPSRRDRRATAFLLPCFFVEAATGCAMGNGQGGDGKWQGPC